MNDATPGPGETAQAGASPAARPGAAPAPPLAVLAEITHRCPLQCPYCSNPVELERAAGELDTATWLDLIQQMADMGVLQLHFSGGEPTARKDLAQLIAKAADCGLYTNLITSAVNLNPAKVKALSDAGIDHIQVSFQDSRPKGNDRIGGYAGSFEKKREACRLIRAEGIPLTFNLVVHRQNLDHLQELIDMAVELDAHRIEVAHVQYYGWAYRNREALLPSRAQLEEATRVVEENRERLKNRLSIDYVVPDYYARRPKACMGGWGKQFLNISPAGKVLPCHAAESITTLRFDTVKERSLADIWLNSEAFRKYRGTDWLPEPCASCERKEIDWGGCRCQAFAFTGDAGKTDPACEFSPFHEEMVGIARDSASVGDTGFIYRNFKNAPSAAKG